MPDCDGAPTLSCRELTRGFGKEVILHEVALDLWQGEVGLLMGPSGSGKTTLLAMLSGLLPPERGQVWALGQDLWRLSEGAREEFRRRYCGFIFQQANLFPALTAWQQLEMVLCWGEGLLPREARPHIERMLSLLGLARKAHLRPGQLSGGEMQRIAIGRALVKAPKLCFADEPTSALDWGRGQEVVALLRGAAQELGTTVLLVGHDPRLAAGADRVFHLEEGRLVEAAVEGVLPCP